MPKILYILRTAPCFRSTLLEDFDSIQRSLLEGICNIQLNDDSWIQAALPINAGGLGICSAAKLAPSAYLASAAGCATILQTLLPDVIYSSMHSLQHEAITIWQKLSTEPPPTEDNAAKQRCWDFPVIEATFNNLLLRSEQKSRARLLACKQKESGAWLTAPPISAVGLRLDDETIRVAVGLCLGTPLCVPHPCQHCGEQVDQSATHGLSCVRSQGRNPRHAELNQFIHRTLASIKVPSTLEPQGLSHRNRCRPDGMSLIPWSHGRALIWDVTVHDTLAPSYLHLSSSRAGSVVDNASGQKRRLYSDLTPTHHLIPLAFETMGTFSSDSMLFLKDVTRRIRLIKQAIRV